MNSNHDRRASKGPPRYELIVGGGSSEPEQRHTTLEWVLGSGRVQEMEEQRMATQIYRKVSYDGQEVGTPELLGKYLAYLAQNKLLGKEEEIELGQRVSLQVGSRTWEGRRVRTFADVDAAELLVYQDSYRRLAVAVRDGSAAERLALAADSEVRIRASR